MFLYFLLWTLLLYWVHRFAHWHQFARSFHLHHHQYVLTNNVGWHWSNLLLFNDDWTSTIDLWITEVIPTILFSLATGQWWISVFYYVWAAFIQEIVEHNPNINLPIFTCGAWHLIHHKSSTNYGLFIPLWDKIFGTYVKVTK